jgi:amino acid transporter
LGALFGVILQVLMLTSLFACVLSFHNTINRYLFVIAREGLLPKKLAETHAAHQSPHVAGLVQLILLAVVFVILGLAGLDPTIVVGWASGFTAIGILIIQILVSVSVVAFFNRDARGVSLCQRLIAPAISVVALAICLYLLVANIQYVSGSESPVVKSFPLIIGLLIVAGIVLANWLKSARPQIYSNLGKILN